jgi:hypothetical protein
MKLYNLGIKIQSEEYLLDRISGSLVQMPAKRGRTNKALPEKLNECLSFCHQPYALKRQLVDSTSSSSVPFCQKNLSARAAWLVKLSRSNFFWLASFYASVGRPHFEESSSAIAFFRQQMFAYRQDTLCLSRSLFAASTSKRFADAGVLFIGVFLPSRCMHAWIIEDGRQPDCQDSMWVNFRPVAAFC